MKTMKQNQTISNLKKCPRWNYCSTNICPLDPDVNLRNKLPKENICPFCLKKKAGYEEGTEKPLEKQKGFLYSKSKLKTYKTTRKRGH